MGKANEAVSFLHLERQLQILRTGNETMNHWSMYDCRTAEEPDQKYGQRRKQRKLDKLALRPWQKSQHLWTVDYCKKINGQTLVLREYPDVFD